MIEKRPLKIGWKTMFKQLEDAFEKTYDRYFEILTNYYPAHNGTGFTERNLTHNFTISLENVLVGRSVSWFEAPINLKAKNHIDAVVFDLDEKCNFMIEAKRFSSPAGKIAEVKKDIIRMTTPCHYELLEKNLRHIEIQKRYAVVIADVWKENPDKKEIFEDWPACISGKQKGVWSRKKGFEKLPVNGEWKNNYGLLIAAFEVG